MRVRFFFILLLCLAAVSCGPGTAGGKVPTDPSILVSTLPNGLTLMVKRHAHPPGRVLARLVISGGASVERGDELGFAHLVEHMAWEGTRRFPGKAVDAWLEGLGTGSGPYSGAYTSWHDVSYRLALPSASEDGLRTAMEVFADWMTGISFGEEALAREKLVVYEELRTTFGAGRRLDFAHAGGEDEETGVDDILGDPRVLRAASGPDLARFWSKWYAPSLATVLVVGDVEGAAVERVFAECLGKVPWKLPPYFPKFGQSAGNGQGGVTVADDSSLADCGFELRWSLDVPALKGADGYGRRLAVDRVVAMTDFALRRVARDASNGLISASCSPDPYGERAYDVVMRFSCAPEDRETAVARAIGVIARISSSGFSPAEHGFWRDWSASAFASDAYSKLTATEMIDLMEASLSGVASLASGDFAKSARQALALPERDGDLDALARDVFSSAFPAVRIDLPESATLAPEDAEREIAAALSSPVNVPDPAVPKPFAQVPRSGARATVERIGNDAYAIECGNGVRAVAARTAPGSGLAAMRSVSPGGKSRHRGEEYAHAADSADAFFFLASEMEPFGAVEDFLLRKSISFDPWISHAEEGIDASFPAAEADAFLAFLADCLAEIEPREVETGAFGEWLQSGGGSVPTGEGGFFDAVEAAAWGGHPASSEYRPESVDAPLAVSIARERFCRPADFAFAFAGDFDPVAFLGKVDATLGRLPGSAIRERGPRSDFPELPSGSRLERDDGDEDRAWNVLVWEPGFSASADRGERLALLELCLSDMLFKELRGGRGGVYGVDVYSKTVACDPPEIRVFAEFQCAPERAEELRSRALDLAAEVAYAGFSVEAVERALSARALERRDEAATPEGAAGRLLETGFPGHDSVGTLGAGEREPDPGALGRELGAALGKVPAVIATLLPPESRVRPGGTPDPGRATRP